MPWSASSRPASARARSDPEKPEPSAVTTASTLRRRRRLLVDPAEALTHLRVQLRAEALPAVPLDRVGGAELNDLFDTGAARFEIAVDAGVAAVDVINLGHG